MPGVAGGNPRPATPHADRILGSYWEDSLTPGDLSRRSLELDQLAARLLDTAQNGQVGADQLLNYGQGALAETISAAWDAYFVRMAAVAGQCVEAAACLKAWATALGALLSGMSAIVWRTEELIIAAEVEAAALGKDATQEVNNLIDEAHSEVSALSAGTTAALSPLPAWVPALPPTSTGPGTVSGGSELSAPADGDPSSLAAPSDPATLVAPSDPAAPPPSDPATLAAPSDPATAPAPTGVASPSASPGTGASTPAAVSSPSTPVASPAAAGAPVASAPTGQAAAATGAPLNSNPTTPTSAPAATSAPQVAPVQSAPVSTTSPPAAAWPGPSIPAESYPAVHHVDGNAPAVAAALTPAAPVPPPAAPPVTGAPSPAAAVGPGASPPVTPAVSPPVASPVAPLHSSSGGIAPPPLVPKPVAMQLHSGGSDSEPAAGLVSTAAAAGPRVHPVNEDLELLRRILRAIGGGDVVGYAAAVVVSDGGREVVLTSDRGRGWMPPGVVIPAEVTSPWDHAESTGWEGLIDPCRVLREYAEAQGVALAAVVTSRYVLPAGIPAEHVEVSQHAHPELLRGRVNGRVEWQAAELADTVQSWPHPEDSHRQAMACAWLAHQKAADPHNRRGIVLRAVFERARQGVRTHEHRAAGAGAAWQPLLERWASLGFDEVRARRDPAGIDVGRLDDGGAAITRPLLATLYADEATIALLRPGPEAREAALYSAAMLGVGAP